MDEIKTQLEELYGALSVANESEKASLKELIQDLEQLVHLTSAHSGNSATNLSENYICSSSNLGLDCTGTDSEKGNQCDDDEFERFQKEINSLDSNLSEENGITNSNEGSRQGTEIKDLLSQLEGMKCKAPFEHHWGQFGYHSAIVYSAEYSTEEPEPADSETEILSQYSVTVRVIFAQPLTEAMRPCPYFLEGRCRFSEDECKFSHGELVALSDLKDYREPDFSLIVSGSRILAKYSDELWYHATVIQILESGDCEITYDSYNEKASVPLQDTFPLDCDEDAEVSDLSSGDTSDSGDEVDEIEISRSEQSEKIWKNMIGNSVLGQWEIHTKGIGSRLMQKMGYVLGTGLGKDGEGRIDPIDATVLPPGRSLDACMELKEKAGSAGTNLFSVERRLKRIQKKEKLRAEKLQEKNEKSESVFSFLNSRLNLSKKTVKRSKTVERLDKESGKNLNRKLLNIGENIKQVNKEIVKCKEGMKRHEGRDHSTVGKMRLKMNSLEKKLEILKQNELSVTSEQRQRSDKKKLLIF